MVETPTCRATSLILTELLAIKLDLYEDNYRTRCA
jgi:hypothetical protein